MIVKLPRPSGVRIKAIRKRKRLTQEGVVRRIDNEFPGQSISSATIGRIEREETMPSDATLIRLARALEVPLRDFYTEEQIKTFKEKVAAFLAGKQKPTAARKADTVIGAVELTCGTAKKLLLNSGGMDSDPNIDAIPAHLEYVYLTAQCERALVENDEGEVDIRELMRILSALLSGTGEEDGDPDERE